MHKPFSIVEKKPIPIPLSDIGISMNGSYQYRYIGYKIVFSFGLSTLIHIHVPWIVCQLLSCIAIVHANGL